jgi:hypothetical protein
LKRQKLLNTYETKVESRKRKVNVNTWALPRWCIRYRLDCRTTIRITQYILHQ